MTEIHFYRGLRTIGGTVIEIATDSARCLFDFGSAGLDAWQRPVNPRPDKRVYDALRTGALPAIDGIYDHTDLCDLPLDPYDEDAKRPVFFLISHVHIDHIGSLDYLDESIPVYMTRKSLRIYQTLCELGDFEYRPHRNCVALDAGDWVTVGDIRFRALPVDHDIPGACGFEIVTPDGRIAYTGDFRLHGFDRADSLDFVRAVQGADLCISEGVTVSFIEDFDAVIPTDELSERSNSEARILTEIAAAAGLAPGLVFLNVYPRNLERLRRLPELLRQHDREMVWEPDTAFLLESCCGLRDLSVYTPFEKGERSRDRRYITREILQSDPGRYVLQLSLDNLLETLDFSGCNPLYLHANGVPLGDYDPAYRQLLDFLEMQNIPFLTLGCGGHAEPANLKFLLETIAPRYLVPLHSLTPEKIKIRGSQQILPPENSVYKLENGKLI